MALETLSPLDELEAWLVGRNQNGVTTTEDGSETKVITPANQEAVRQLEMHRQDAEYLEEIALPVLDEFAQLLKKGGDSSANAKVLGPVQEKDNKWTDQPAQALLSFGLERTPGSTIGFFQSVICKISRIPQIPEGKIAGLQVIGHEPIIQDRTTFEATIANMVRAKIVSAESRAKASQTAKPANVLLTPLHNVRR